MSPLDVSAIEQRVSAFEDVDLQRMVALETSEWRTEALEIARTELHSRNVPILSKEEFLAAYPDEELGASGFCEACEAETTDGSMPNPWLLLLIGVRTIPGRERCPRCRSRVVRQWWPLTPLVPLGRYRVISEGQGPTAEGTLSRRIGSATRANAR